MPKANHDVPTPDALAFAVRRLAEVAVRVSATWRKVYPGGASDDLHTFVTDAARSIADALAHEEKE